MADTGVTYVQAPPGTPMQAGENEPRRLMERKLVLEAQENRELLRTRTRERVSQLERGSR